MVSALEHAISDSSHTNDLIYSLIAEKLVRICKWIDDKQLDRWISKQTNPVFKNEIILNQVDQEQRLRRVEHYHSTSFVLQII